MRRLLLLACRAFPREHRARRSDEVVDTALLAADGSAWRTTREAVSLVVAGMGQRLRAESHRSLRDGVAVLAGVLAVFNLALALAGIAACISTPEKRLYYLFGFGWGGSVSGNGPYTLDWWLIAFAVAAVGVALGLMRGSRRLALGAAIANLGLVAYDAIFLAGFLQGHLKIFTFEQTPDAFPGGRQWLAGAVLLALATAVAPLRRLPLGRLPLAALLLLAVAFGALAPRLAALAAGATLVAAPSALVYLTEGNLHHHPSVTGFAAAALALAAFAPLVHLVRRRVT